MTVIDTGDHPMLNQNGKAALVAVFGVGKSLGLVVPGDVLYLLTPLLTCWARGLIWPAGMVSSVPPVSKRPSRWPSA